MADRYKMKVQNEDPTNESITSNDIQLIPRK